MNNHGNDLRETKKTLMVGWAVRGARDCGGEGGGASVELTQGQ